MYGLKIKLIHFTYRKRHFVRLLSVENYCLKCNIQKCEFQHNTKGRIIIYIVIYSLENYALNSQKKQKEKAKQKKINYDIKETNHNIGKQ